MYQTLGKGAPGASSRTRAPLALPENPFNSITEALQQQSRASFAALKALGVPKPNLNLLSKNVAGYAEKALGPLKQVLDVDMKDVSLDTLSIDSATLDRFSHELDTIANEAIKRANGLAGYASGATVVTRVLMTTIHNFATALTKVNKALDRIIQELGTDRADTSRVMFVSRRPMHPNAFTRRTSRGGVHMGSRMTAGAFSVNSSTAAGGEVWRSLLPESEDRTPPTLK